MVEGAHLLDSDFLDYGMLATTYQTTCCHKPERPSLNLPPHGNLKNHMRSFTLEGETIRLTED
jgi:hypothetical protein